GSGRLAGRADRAAARPPGPAAHRAPARDPVDLPSGCSGRPRLRRDPDGVPPRPEAGSGWPGRPRARVRRAPDRAALGASALRLPRPHRALPPAEGARGHEPSGPGLRLAAAAGVQRALDGYGTPSPGADRLAPRPRAAGGADSPDGCAVRSALR